MCGIAGYFNLDGSPANPAVVQKMTAALAHRGPDAQGTLVEGPVALGHARLSIIDVSAASNQPFTDQSGNFSVVFNGELYNYEAVKAALKQKQFKTSGDTEALIEAWQEQGISCISQFTGMFAFGMWNRNTHELTLVRDRMGVKPLYYYRTDKCILFASEIRSLLASGMIPRKLCGQGLKELLSYQSVSAPHTLVEGIRQLPAAHFLRISATETELKCYWDITTPEAQHPPQSKAEAIRETRRLLLESVRSRMVSDVPVGAFLSGGIDSSVVVALMSEVSSQPVNTFTVAFTEKEFDESEHAATIARKFNTRHQEIWLKPTVMLEELDAALKAMDTPSGDGINTYVVSQAVKKAGITVALSGVGGDELFAGYPFFERYRKLQQFSGAWENTGVLRRTSARILQSTGNQRIGKLAAMLHEPSGFIASMYPHFRTILHPDQIAALVPDSVYEEEAVSKYLRQHTTRIRRFPSLSQVSLAEYAGYTQHTLLKDTDQMGMAHALEIREPFFDHDLISYVLQLPDAFKKGNRPKSLLVASLGELLPSSIVDRPKQGFVFPWSIWLKGPLREFCETHLKRMAERPIVDGKALLDHWNRFLNGDPAIRWMEVWLFVILENWLEAHQVN